MIRLVLLLTMLCVAGPAWATTYYLDNSVGSSGTGLSWAAAWKNFSDITGLVPGDLVYISGGAGGQTYEAGQYRGASGSSGNPITYRVSSDVGKNGHVTINGPAASPWSFFYAQAGYNQWVTIDGEVSGTINLTIDSPVGFDFEQAQGLTVRYANIYGANLGYDSDTIEFAYCEFYARDSDGWGNFAALTGLGRNQGATTYPTGFTRILIHHNIFHMLYLTGTGDGDDAIQNVGNASIYNNTFIGEVGAYTHVPAQHADGIQTKGPNLLIYNNHFEGIANYPVFIEIGGTFTVTARIYNNVFYNNLSSNVYSGSNQDTSNVNDVIISNNTFINGGSGGAIRVNSGRTGQTYTNHYVVNNLFYNVTTTTNLVSSGVTSSNNTNGDTTGKTFVSNAAYPSGDFTLTVGATAAIDLGLYPLPAYLSDVYTTDAAGNTRAQGTSWDIGAYEYNQGGPSNPPVPPPQPPPAATGYYQANERPAAGSRTTQSRTAAGTRTIR